MQYSLKTRHVRQTPMPPQLGFCHKGVKIK